MEELKLILTTLEGMGDTALMAFVIWCVKELLIMTFLPLSLGVVGYSIYRCIRAGMRESSKIAKYEDAVWNKKFEIRKIDLKESKAKGEFKGGLK